MKVRRLSQGERRGYCNGCHNRAAIEIEVSTKQPVLRLCERDVRLLVADLSKLVKRNGNGEKNHKK